MWRHPKYYKELRKRNELAQRSAVKEDLACSGSSPARNNSDQVISRKDSTEARRRAPGQGLKQHTTSDKPQAANKQPASDKPQAKPEPSSGS